MAPGRKRRLVTRLLKWVWVPVVAFVLVVAVAMGCAVWSPERVAIKRFGSLDTWRAPVPAALRQFDLPYMSGSETGGVGMSFYYVNIPASPPPLGPGHPISDWYAIGRAGLPFRCLRWVDDHPVHAGSPSLWLRGIETHWTYGGGWFQRRIPLMPEPVGMALNVLIVSAAIVLPRLAWRRAVVHRRERKRLCVKCAYPLGDFAVCPECGNRTGRDA